MTDETTAVADDSAATPVVDAAVATPVVDAAVVDTAETPATETEAAATPVAEAVAADTAVPVADATADAAVAPAAAVAEPAAADAVVYDAPADDGSHVVSDALPEVHTPAVDGVAIDTADHARAKDVFAALLGALEEEHKAIARELGALLSLHTVASGQADTTGDYTAGDLTK